MSTVRLEQFALNNGRPQICLSHVYAFCSWCAHTSCGLQKHVQKLQFQWHSCSNTYSNKILQHNLQTTSMPCERAWSAYSQITSQANILLNLKTQLFHHTTVLSPPTALSQILITMHSYIRHLTLHSNDTNFFNLEYIYQNVSTN